MKSRFILFRRKGVFYIEDREKNTQRSLHTKDAQEAARLLGAHNEASHQKMFALQMAQVYLAASEPEMETRTWNDVFDEIIRTKKGLTHYRWGTAKKDVSLKKLLPKKLIETTARDFLDVLATGTVSTNVFLRRVHNFAHDMNWILNPIIPKRQWPAVRHGAKRAVTREEHERIVERETNFERRDFYEMLWHFGGSQSDIALLRADDIDWNAKTVSFVRSKLRHREDQTPPIVHFGPHAEEILRRRPALGLLFPYLASVRSSDRATEFKQRCQGLKISGITLHSYRYSWAERAAEAGYPERFAMQALGHASKAVHRVYARKAKSKIPSLEVYESGKEGRIIPFQNSQEPSLAHSVGEQAV